MCEAPDRQTQTTCPACHHRRTPRDPEELKALKNRLNRMTGQLNGIARMLEEDRYCGDILIQIAAVQKALESFGYTVLESHMNACVAQELERGNRDILRETVDLMKQLK
ncbi:MAG: metal-sensing transcriptional repressor [Clostridia bacterium]|nr:metal-sensing transcriptional repressor [Clostridia bacterium]